MIATLLVAAAAMLLFWLLGGAPQLTIRRRSTAQPTNEKVAEMFEYANRLRAGNKYTSAEKVYLQILKLDHRHVPTYSALGFLYAAKKNPGDAIECFQMATQLSPGGSTFYNLGLAFYENQNPMKAIAAFEKAVMFEPSINRYLALAKAMSKIHDGDGVMRALESAAELDPSPRVLWLLADAYEAAGRYDDLSAIHERIKVISPRDPRLKSLKKPSKQLASTS
jgi:tetratricopeptide (TPR) repeat protein